VIIAGVMLVIALIIGLSLGGWDLYWRANTAATNKSAQIYQKSYGAQSAYVEQLRNQINQIDGIEVQINAPQTPSAEVPSLQAQKAAIVNQACGIADSITPPLPADEASFAASNC